LKQQGYKVYRPCAFFLTDGVPQDEDWEETFKSTLTYDPATGQGMKGHPIFVPFGFGQASPATLAKLAYPARRGKWYMHRDANPALAVRNLLDVIMKTVIASSMSSLTPQPAVELDRVPDGGPIIQGDYDPDYV
jgi:uncharacterized protein YegL